MDSAGWMFHHIFQVPQHPHRSHQQPLAPGAMGELVGRGMLQTPCFFLLTYDSCFFYAGIGCLTPFLDTPNFH